MEKFNQTIEKAKKVSLTAEEKSEIRGFLFAAVKGVNIGVLARFWKPAFAAMLIIITIGSGVSFAAENTLPGDVLYPIKIKVNEEVRSALSLSSESKASWAARRLERRLEEFEKLVEGNKLDVKRKAIIEAGFTKRAAVVKEKIDMLESKPDANLEAAVKTAVRTEKLLINHGKVFKNNPNLNSFVGKIESETKDISEKRVRMEKIRARKK